MESVKNYLYTGTPFELFGPDHIWAFAVSIILTITIPLYARHKMSPRGQDLLGLVIGVIVMSNYLTWIVLELLAGTFEISRHLPLHLCRFADLAIILVMWKKSYRMFEILYFWGLSGVLQSSITPDVSWAFPHFHYFRFFIGHNGLVLAVVYAAVVYGMRPTFKSIWKALIAMNAFLVVALITNLLLNTNYFWIMGKPTVPTLLDYMGPWPWYILTGEFVALAHFGLAYLPIAWLKKRSQKSEIPAISLRSQRGRQVRREKVDSW